MEKRTEKREKGQVLMTSFEHLKPYIHTNKSHKTACLSMNAASLGKFGNVNQKSLKNSVTDEFREVMSSMMTVVNGLCCVLASR